MNLIGYSLLSIIWNTPLNMEIEKNKSFHEFNRVFIFIDNLEYPIKTWKMKKKFHNSSPKKSEFEKRGQN
jgi:hypothetical protein